jgi:murein L,D-transpeptidase YcbB/YkuD
MRFIGARAAVLPVAFMLSVQVVSLPVMADPLVQGAATPTTNAPDTQVPVVTVPSESVANGKAPEASVPASPAATTTGNTASDAAVQLPAATTATAQPGVDTTPVVATPAAVAVTPPTPPADPVMDSIRTRLSVKAAAQGAAGEYAETLKAFYATRTEPLWIKDGALTVKAQAAAAEIKKADAYGLDASQFELTDLAPGAAPDTQAASEIQLTIAVLKYAHHARGGRIDPLALSNILDMKPPIKDPAAVLTEIAVADAPDAYLRGLHPKYPDFEKLRLALEKARGPQAETPVDEALKIKLPKGKTLKIGQEHNDVALLRKRLKAAVPSDASERLYDAMLEAALKVYQENNGLNASGQLDAKTRDALNSEGEPKTADPKRDVDRIIANMERWRWLPEDPGRFYIINNIPEFSSRVIKDGSELLKVKMIVGEPSWPTPILASSLQFVIFQPEWGVPDGIKMKELLPRLKKASAQSSGFFDQLFGGGSSSGGARVLAAYKLTPSLDGRSIDANSIDWNKVDIRRFSFVQPAGSENPLGQVKFRFPNRHDVYMHDTPQKALFNQSFRALSHGCMRIDNHRRMAEVLLAEDKGWSPEKVAGMYGGGTRDITLDKPIPVYLTYFTVRVGDDGKLQKFGDIYGHDDRVTSALQGKPVRYKTPEKTEAVASTEDTLEEPPPAAPAKKQSNKKPSKTSKQNTETAGGILSDSLSGLIAN